MSTEEKTALEVAEEANIAKVAAENAKRSGKGLRLAAGLTRGRNPQPISFESFDESQPDTLPKSLSEFMDLAKVSDETAIVSYLIDGYNAQSRTNASDPVAEYVDASWSEEVQKSFRLVVRQYSTNAGVSIEDAVSLIKPGYIASQKK